MSLFRRGSSLLYGLARRWVVCDRVEPSDAIIVLGGSLDVRPASAAELYKRDIASLVLVSWSEADRGREARRMRERLLTNGVPSAAVIDFTIKLHSTYGEARGVLEFAKVNDIGRVIVPVEIFQTRRVRWIFRRELSPAGVNVAVNAITPPDYDVDNWWQSVAGRTNFCNELIKFTYYRFRY